MSKMSEGGAVWTRRFIWGAMIQGGVVFVITSILIYLNLPTSGFVSPARVVASGSAGTWLEIGFIGYMLFCVLGTGLSAFFYYIENVMDRPYTGRVNVLPWVHLLLGNIFGGIGLILMMWGGYQGGAAMTPVALGGLGQGLLYVHENILGPIATPIAYLFVVGGISPLAGGIAYFLPMRQLLPWMNR